MTYTIYTISGRRKQLVGYVDADSAEQAEERYAKKLGFLGAVISSPIIAEAADDTV